MPTIHRTSRATLSHTNSARKGVLGYADELFEKRINQDEIKMKKRAMVESVKFEFQKPHVTAAKQNDDFTVSEDMLGELKNYLKKNNK